MKTIKRGVWIAAGALLLIAAVLLIAMLFLYDRETLRLLWPPFACIFGVPATVNAAVVTALFVRWRKRQPKGA